MLCTVGLELKSVEAYVRTQPNTMAFPESSWGSSECLLKYLVNPRASFP